MVGSCPSRDKKRSTSFGDLNGMTVCYLMGPGQGQMFFFCYFKKKLFV